MSLDTLLEAAEFLEWRNQSKTRVDESAGRVSSTNGSDTSQDSYSSAKIIYMDPDDATLRRRAGGAGTREVHNKLEKNRRAHLKECFDILKKQIPTLEDKRTSNLCILRGSIRYIQAVKRKEKEYELEMQRLAREKITLQERIHNLKSELARMNIEVDLNKWVTLPDEQDTNSTSTATEQGSPICSDDDDDDIRSPNKSYMGERDIVKKLFPGSSNQNAINHQRELTIIKVSKPDHVNMPAATILKIPTSKSPLQQHLMSPIQGNSLLTKPPLPARPEQTSSAPATVTTSNSLDTRTPVTQLLARTLEKRQKQQQSAIVTVTSVSPSVKPPPVPTVPLKTIPLRHSLGIPIATQFVAAQGAAQLAAINKLVSQGTLAMPVSMAKGFAQPILVSTNLMTGLTSSQQQQILNSAATQSMAKQTAAATSSITTATTTVKVTALSATPLSASTLSTTPLSATQLSGTPSMATLGNVSNIRPLANTGTTHMLGQIPFNILAQALPRTSLGQVVTPSTSTVSVSIPSSLPQNVNMQQLMSLAQITQGTQLVSPMTVMSPGVQFAQGLTQTQLNSMLSSPLLKQIPLIPHGFLQGAQMGGVLGQQVVKPVVVVSLPSVVSTTATTSTIAATTTTTTS
ncbi:max-binding protein MNT-like [Saccostrea echinata]|uniref:max-binding protein MNT-like n=1 Tax=Saccostrea echinata TaxID=191078 RepID=UPI002A80EAD4|nr:max-binding protein MNT-like [Saccostrea echinata]